MLRAVSEVIKSSIPQVSLVLRGLNDAQQVIPSLNSKKIPSFTLNHSVWEGWDLPA